MTRIDRKPIKWEDTLSQKEKEHIEKMTAQTETIDAFKQASKENSLASLLNALALTNLPSDFKEVKSEFHERIRVMIKEEAGVKHLTLRGSYVREGLTATVEHLSDDLIDIDFKHKKLIMKENKWIRLFQGWKDEKTVETKLDWLRHKRKELETGMALSEAVGKEIQEMKKADASLLKWQAHWKVHGDAPDLAGVLNDVDRIVALLATHGYVVEKEGFERKSHYVFKTPHRWEEDHGDELTKWQKRFARPLNEPDPELLHTHYGSHVTDQLHPVLTIAGIDNAYTKGWYERRFVDQEWLDLPKAFQFGGFKVSRGAGCVTVIHEESGNEAEFYPNGHLYVTVQEDADPLALASRVGILPFLLAPSFKDWADLLIRNTVQDERDL